MSDQAKIIGLEKQIKNLRWRLDQARENVWKGHDLLDKLELDRKRRDELLGPDYRFPSVCTDGRVFAHPAESAREETIRWFAGQALGRASSIADAADAAFALWSELENRLGIDRTAREIEAARKAVEAADDTADEAGPEGE